MFYHLPDGDYYKCCGSQAQGQVYVVQYSMEDSGDTEKVCLLLSRSYFVILLHVPIYVQEGYTGPPLPKRPKADPNQEVSAKVVLMICHGDYNNWAVPDQQGLTPCGKVQAAGTAKYIKRIHGLPHIPKVVSSTMIRAKETATVIHKEFPEASLEFDYDLTEGSPDHAHTRERFDRVFNSYFVPCQGPTATCVLVAHANLIRYLICR